MKRQGMSRIQHSILLLFLLLSVEVEAMAKVKAMRRPFGAAYKQKKLIQDDECYNITGCSREYDNCPKDKCKCKFVESQCIPIGEFDCNWQGCTKENEEEVCPEEEGCGECDDEGGYCKY